MCTSARSPFARPGVPFGEDQWEWLCGFYPGAIRDSIRKAAPWTSTARGADFEVAWARLLATRTEEHFQEWRDQRDWTARKYQMWKRGGLLPSQKPNTMMRCPSGVAFNSHDPEGSLAHRRHIYAAQATYGIRR